MDGKKIGGETGDTLTLQWEKNKPHTRTYSVVPIYTVFNETVRGEPAEAKVDFRPYGMIINVR